MEKPRVLIADTNQEYIAPLQLKLIQELKDRINLEIITDTAYFERLFSSPQKIDVLILSEEMYGITELQRHNISYIFLMMEQEDSDELRNPMVKKLFKYSSIKEIYNEILRQTAGILTAANEQNQQTEIIAVTSGFGGAGKTSVAMGVCACLERNYKSTLYVNASKLNTFQHMLQNPSAVSDMAAYAKLVNPSPKIYQDVKHVIRKEKFSYFPPLKASLLSLGIHESLYAKLIKSAKESRDYDYIVVDIDSTFDEVAFQILNMADKVIVVTDQSNKAANATGIYVSNINGVNAEKYIFICNKFRKDLHNAITDANRQLNYSVNEYVQEYDLFDELSIQAISEKPDIRKVAFLIV